MAEIASVLFFIAWHPSLSMQTMHFILSMTDKMCNKQHSDLSGIPKTTRKWSFRSRGWVGDAGTEPVLWLISDAVSTVVRGQRSV